MRNKLKKYVGEKLISETKHPDLDLRIYTYTPLCQYKQAWDEVTLKCRGLILDKEGNIISRPFKKFFNLGEHVNKGKEIPLEPFEVYKKEDGSLGISYFDKNTPKLATKGSFTSEQAIKGTEILHRDFKDYPFNKNYTYLFEIIYPENRIVVNYKDKEELILLAVIYTQTGKELPLNQFKKDFHIAFRYEGIKDINELKDKQEDNAEGYVIKFKSGLRLKLKFEEYIRLHRLVTETNTKRVWEYLKDKHPIKELLDRVPDEFYKWVKDTIVKLELDYKELEEEAKREFNKIKYTDRRDFADQIKKHRNKSILFKLLDKRSYDKIIWQMIKPKTEKPFKREI